MLIILIILTVVFSILGMWLSEHKPNQLIMLGLAVFLGIGSTYLCYQEGEAYYAYIPLSFAVVSLIYAIYVIWGIIIPKEWGSEDEND